MWYTDAQALMRERAIHAWFVHDFRNTNSTFNALVPHGLGHLTRRVGLVIPATGEPTLITSHIDATFFADTATRLARYLTWREYQAMIGSLLKGAATVAMEYSPNCDLPVVSTADAGTVEFVRSLGVRVVSSADLVQATVARWSSDAVTTYARTAREVSSVKDDAFAFIRDTLASGKPCDEWMVVKRMHEQYARLGLEYPDGPIVAANAHAGDPHYDPTEATSMPIRKGDFVLIDLWARRPGNQNIFCDICWVGACGSPTDRQVEVFETVRRARDAAVAMAQQRWAAKQAVAGWEVDDAAMGVLRASPWPDAIRHRTGHSLSPGPKVHGLGVNIDNTETHDTRELLPGVGFTIEPGLYFDDFGVRSEINVHVDPTRGPTVVSEVQKEILRLA